MVTTLLGGGEGDERRRRLVGGGEWGEDDFVLGRSTRRISIEPDILPISFPDRTWRHPSYLRRNPPSNQTEATVGDGDSVQSCWRSRAQARLVRVSTTFGATTPVGGGDRKDVGVRWRFVELT
ncbi:hypothetical protein CRG98_021235 [Punica granatum]|uniref:Uncharacterized protein n=1 Tax=Punica granatum TaxID=22663 RepID=A0A2I0JR26_PUNGR|nr:hypothetical protein CRG98_021235 [Punica granatum]